MRWIDGLAGWGGELPVVLVTRASGTEARRAALRALIARALGVDEAEVAVLHEPGRAPRLVRPARPLGLSSASRGGVAALAVAHGPVGVDLERVEAGGIPRLVLHPDEAAALGALPEAARGGAFARLWSLKEAYLKALGTGLRREPSSFAVHLGDGPAVLADPQGPDAAVEAATTWREAAGARLAVSAVLLHPRPSLM